MSENSFIAILNRMKSRITTEADRREGTWTADNLQAVANELARGFMRRTSRTSCRRHLLLRRLGRIWTAPAVIME